MSYFIEFGQSWNEGFYQEFRMIDGETGAPLSSAGIDHQFKVCDEIRDYGDWIMVGQTIASNSNGLIYPTTELGISAIKVPSNRFSFCGGDISWRCDQSRLSRSVQCALLAVPANADDAKLISTGTITFGASTTMPRITLKAIPFYPAPNIPALNATQVKIQLAKVNGQYDLVEAALPASPLDPARITWDSGGPISLGGPLSNVVAGALGYDPVAMTIFLVAAAANPT